MKYSPCPSCGSTKLHVNCTGEGGHFVFYDVECDNCGLCGPDIMIDTRIAVITEQMVADKWNKLPRHEES